MIGSLQYAGGVRIRLAGLGAVIALVTLSCQTDPTQVEPNVRVHVSLAGDGDGEVLSLDPQVDIDCRRIDLGCETTFYDAGGGGEFQLQATPTTGSLFGGWSGDCSGTAPRCTLSFAEPAPGVEVQLYVTATFLLVPDQVQVTVQDDVLDPGQSTQATAAVTGSGAFSEVEFTWQSSDPSIASVAASSPTTTATVVALSAGATNITAQARGVTSNAVTVTVADPGPDPGALRGTVFDTDDVTGLEGLVVRIGGPTATPSQLTAAGGGYEAADLTAGSYTVYVQGRLGFRFLSSEVHDVAVTAGDTVTEDVFLKEGNHLEIQNGSHTVQVAAGGGVSLSVDFRAWNRVGCPACEPSMIVGIDGEPMVLHRFATPGSYPGTEYTPTLDFTAPGEGGNLYAMLVTGISTGTAEGQEQARTVYRDRFTSGLWVETFIPIGTLEIVP